MDLHSSAGGDFSRRGGVYGGKGKEVPPNLQVKIARSKQNHRNNSDPEKSGKDLHQPVSPPINLKTHPKFKGIVMPPNAIYEPAGNGSGTSKKLPIVDDAGYAAINEVTDEAEVSATGGGDNAAGVTQDPLYDTNPFSGMEQNTATGNRGEKYLGNDGQSKTDF